VNIMSKGQDNKKYKKKPPLATKDN
jgi:hypothetical protein